MPLDAQGDRLVVASVWRAVLFSPRNPDYKEQHFAGIADRGISIAISKWQPLLAVGGLWSMRVWDIQSHKEVTLEQGEFGVGDGMLFEQIAFGDEGQLLAALVWI